ncbi:MAG: hypothetical protein ACI9NY_000195 [Kiritimatiellia bacterium]|jgi:hypothetical protein
MQGQQRLAKKLAISGLSDSRLFDLIERKVLLGYAVFAGEKSRKLNMFHC